MMDTSTKGAPRSKEFDDVYFSVTDGLAETRHVFLAENNLPQRFLDRNDPDRFVIGETGFGTGLNFLAVWKLFLEHRQSNPSDTDRRLHFISFEKFPLSAAQIAEYLEPWRIEFPDLFDVLVKKYPQDPSGIVELDMGGGVSLTLIFQDVNTGFSSFPELVDCWFLDGFKPSSNPDMWSETVFNAMARFSKEGATFATFTAAGFVKRGLQSAGFTVEKVRGFGRKREMLRGYYSQREHRA